MANPKLFTVEQAEKTLPLVRRIVADITRAFERLESIAQERHALGPQPNPGSNAEERAFTLERELQASQEEILRCQEELQTLGIELKDYRSGLIDFFSRYEDRLVYLCWKLDEGATISWWHGLEAGFRGRAAITPLNRSQFLCREK